MAAAAARPQLYSFWRSSCAYRARIALAFKGVAYDYIPIDIVAARDQHKPEYVSVNAMSTVPTLQIDGITITQSLAIIRYLESTRPAPSLQHASPADRAAADTIAYTIAADIQPLGNVSVLRELTCMMHDKPGVEDEARGFARRFIERGFTSVERVMSARSGSCAIGDTFSIADICIVPQLANAKRFSVDMARFPTIQRVATGLLRRPYVHAAHPRLQPDADPTM